jgi:hypothetical protein
MVLVPGWKRQARQRRRCESWLFCATIGNAFQRARRAFAAHRRMFDSRSMQSSLVLEADRCSLF